jgi:hypothetical protein
MLVAELKNSLRLLAAAVGWISLGMISANFDKISGSA